MTAVHTPAPSSPPAGTAVSGWVERGWEFRGYHPWNAYCGRAAGDPATGAPTRTATVTPAGVSAVNGQGRLRQPPTLTTYQEDLHRVHDLADHLNRLRLDAAIHTHRHTLPPDLAYELADAIEILTEIRDSLPTGTPHPTN